MASCADHIGRITGKARGAKAEASGAVKEAVYYSLFYNNATFLLGCVVLGFYIFKNFSPLVYVTTVLPPSDSLLQQLRAFCIAHCCLARSDLHIQQGISCIIRRKTNEPLCIEMKSMNQTSGCSSLCLLSFSVGLSLDQWSLSLIVGITTSHDLKQRNAL